MDSTSGPTQGKKRPRVTSAQLRSVTNQWATGSGEVEGEDAGEASVKRAAMVVTFGRNSGMPRASAWVCVHSSRKSEWWLSQNAL